MNTTGSYVLSLDAQRTLTEFEFFRDHPNLGTFNFWQTQGTTSNATYISQLDRADGFLDYLARTLPRWDADHLADRMPELHNLLYASYGAHDTAIYGHWYALIPLVARFALPGVPLTDFSLSLSLSFFTLSLFLICLVAFEQ
jgi:hypothetical protein